MTDSKPTVDNDVFKLEEAIKDHELDIEEI